MLFGCHVSARCPDTLDAAVLHLDPQDLRVRTHAQRTRFPGALTHDRPGLNGVDDADRRAPESAHNDILVDPGIMLKDFLLILDQLMIIVIKVNILI